ncbi:hypothetical protein ACOIDM_29835, partial [Klebsiella pneumoniae]
AKTKITHVNDGFIFLGHRIIRKRSRYGEMRVVSTIPQEKAVINMGDFSLIHVQPEFQTAFEHTPTLLPDGFRLCFG